MNFIRSYLARRKLKKVFGRYVAPELVDRMISAKSNPRPIESRNVEFIWLWMDDSEKKYDERLRLVLELGLNFEAFTENILPPVVTFWFGAFPHIKSPDGAKDALVDKLRMELGGSAKLLHGSVMAKFGNVGSSTRFAFGALTGCRSTLLSELAALDFGKYNEYEKH